FFFSSRRRHTRSKRDWSSDVCSSDLWLQRLAADAAQLAAVFDEIMHTYPFANRQQLRQLLRHFVAAVPIDPANATKGEQEKFKRERRRTHQHLYQLDQQAPLY